MVKRLIMLGAPGVGKGTQAIRLQKDFGWVHISTGDMLRDAVQEGTLLGGRAQKYMERGELVPDDLMVELVANRLNQDDCREGFILDGFPRTVHQAERLDELLLTLDLVLDGVVSIEVSREEITRRLTQRLVCEKCGHMVTIMDEVKEGDRCPSCGGRLQRRKNDKSETVHHRLEVYEKQTRSLIRYYERRNLLKVVDGIGSMEEVYTKILHSLGLTSDQA